MSDSKLQPLTTICFDKPTYIPGAPAMLTGFNAKERILVAAIEFVTPQPYRDPETGNIHIGDHIYPASRVHYWVRAKMAKSSEPPPLAQDYTIGSRPVSRI